MYFGSIRFTFKDKIASIMLDTYDVDRVAVGKGTYQAGKPDWVEGRKEEREEEREE